MSVLDGMSYEQAVAGVECYNTLMINGEEFICPDELGLPTPDCTITDCHDCWMNAIAQHYGK